MLGKAPLGWPTMETDVLFHASLRHYPGCEIGHAAKKQLTGTMLVF
jgi:hypothetical protein